jgi:acyl carrier protein
MVEGPSTDTDVVASKIRAFVHAAVAPDTIDDTTDLFGSGLLGSLFALELVTFIEDEFGFEVEVEDLDIEHFSTLANLRAFVAQKRGLDTPARSFGHADGL